HQLPHETERTGIAEVAAEAHRPAPLAAGAHHLPALALRAHRLRFVRLRTGGLAAVTGTATPRRALVLTRTRFSHDSTLRLLLNARVFARRESRGFGASDVPSPD